jgi:hypothetical protein
MSGDSFLIRDESPEVRVAVRVQAWDGETPNPYCFNCLHTLARHWNSRVKVSYGTLQREGGEAPCNYEGCQCTHYLPSYIDDVL